MGAEELFRNRSQTYITLTRDQWAVKPRLAT